MGPGPAFPLLFQDNPASRPSLACIPNTVFFPNTASRATILANPDSPKAVRSHIPSRNLRYTFYRIPCYILVNSRIPRVLFKTLFSCLLFVRKFDCFQSVTQAVRKKKNPSTPATSSRTYDLLVTQRVQMWLRTLRTLRL